MTNKTLGRPSRRSTGNAESTNERYPSSKVSSRARRGSPPREHRVEADDLVVACQLAHVCLEDVRGRADRESIDKGGDLAGDVVVQDGAKGWARLGAGRRESHLLN